MSKNEGPPCQTTWNIPVKKTWNGTREQAWKGLKIDKRQGERSASIINNDSMGVRDPPV
jgi:hypothetical protein